MDGNVEWQVGIRIVVDHGMEGKLENGAPQVQLYSKVDSRTHNEGQYPSGDVVSICDVAVAKASIQISEEHFCYRKNMGVLCTTTVIPFDI